jgi:hypothetical protein
MHAASAGSVSLANSSGAAVRLLRFGARSVVPYAPLRMHMADPSP